MIVGYNFVIGVLLMLSSQNVASYAGYVNKAHRTQIARWTHVSMFTVGACWAGISGSIYVFVHLLRIGV